jgi:hypothetical protein
MKNRILLTTLFIIACASLHYFCKYQTDIPHVVSSPSFSYSDWKQMAQVAADLEVRNLSNGAKFAAEHIAKKLSLSSSLDTIDKIPEST